MARLLLVAPNVLERSLVAQTLRAGGYEILESNDIEEAGDLARTGSCGLVVDDEPSVTPSVESAPRLVGTSPGIQHVRRVVEQLAQLPAAHLFIVGEPGSGRRNLARVLHATSGGDRPFVQLSSPSVCEDLLSSRLLRGIGTKLVERLWEVGGTLFIPSASELPHDLQLRLVRFAQELELSTGPAVRIVAALTEQPERALVEAALSKAFFDRFPVTLTLEPLRQRRGDIPALTLHLLAERAAEVGRKPPVPSPEALKHLSGYAWPGNTRELCNVLDRTFLSLKDRIDVADLPAFEATAPSIDYRLPAAGIDFADLEREVLVQALRMARSNQTRAAALLKLTRDQMRYRMAKFGLFTPGAAESDDE